MAPEAMAAAHGRGGSSGGSGGGGGGLGDSAKKALAIAAGWLAFTLTGVSSLLLLVLVGGGAGAFDGGCGGGAVGPVSLSGEQMVNARTVVATTVGRGLPVFAAVVAVTTAYTESTLHNSSTETDHDSEGLFQQRISIYTKPVADDPVKATDAFLDRLVGVPSWQTGDPGVDAQTVQASAHPDRYDTNVAFAEQLVGQLWPTLAATTPSTDPSTDPGATAGTSARAAAGATPTAAALQAAPRLRAPGRNTAPGKRPPAAAAPTPGGTPSGTAGATASPVVVVPCTGGGSPGPVGGTGNNVAGQTTIPAGFVVTGTEKGQAAVGFALAQLGKPYVYGAAGPDSWDCSGLTMGSWASQGVALAHFTGTQAGEGTPEPVDLSAAAGGDLVLIPGADGTPAVPGHVGMIAGTSPGPDGRTETWIVQAPMSGIPVELTDATEWAGQIVAVRHIA